MNQTSSPVLKVLIIEDNTFIRQSICEVLYLEWPHILCLEAANGAEGIESAILEKPTLIIVDGELPVLTGFQLVFLLRQMQSTAHIPLLSITGADQENPVVQIMIKTCDDFLPKPFDSNHLLTAVSRLLNIPFTSDPAAGPPISP